MAVRQRKVQASKSVSAPFSLVLIIENSKPCGKGLCTVQQGAVVYLLYE